MNGKKKKEEVEIQQEVVSPEKKKKSKVGFILNIVLYVFLGALLVFDGIVLYSKFNMKSADGTVNFFGREVRIVLTNSMVGTDEFYKEHPDYKIKRIDPHDAVYVQTAPPADTKDQSKIDNFYKNIKVGDILTFIDTKHNDVTNTHRIIEVSTRTNPKTGGTIYDFKMLGDAPAAQKDKVQDASSDDGKVLGKVTGVNKSLGNFLYTFVENKLLVVFTVILPCAIFATAEIVKIILYVNRSHKEKLLLEKQQAISERDEELEKLRKELEELKIGENDSKEEE